MPPGFRHPVYLEGSTAPTESQAIQGARKLSEPPLTIPTPIWNHGGRQPTIRWIVAHDEEIPVGPATAENVACYFRDRPVGAYGSAHFVVDSTSEQHCVPEGLAAYHAPPLSTMGSIGVEQDGYAHFTRADWLTSPSKWTLARFAARTAELCVRHNIPAVKLSVSQLAAGRPGIVEHRDVNAVFGQSNHWDCGYAYPWEAVLPAVRRGMQLLGDVRQYQKAHDLTVDGNPGLRTILQLGVTLRPVMDSIRPDVDQPGGGGGIAPGVGNIGTGAWKRAHPTVSLGSRGEPVKHLQQYLMLFGARTSGMFAADTDRALRFVQAATHVNVDGVCGPQSWGACAHRLLKQGEYGADVQELQAELGVTVDGDFGGKTLAALVSRQRTLGVAADGIAGPATFEALSR